MVSAAATRGAVAGGVARTPSLIGPPMKMMRFRSKKPMRSIPPCVLTAQHFRAISSQNSGSNAESAPPPPLQSLEQQLRQPAEIHITEALLQPVHVCCGSDRPLGAHEPAAAPVVSAPPTDSVSQAAQPMRLTCACTALVSAAAPSQTQMMRGSSQR